MPAVFIGLGSNLDNPQQQLTSALAELAAHPDLTLTAQSSLYASKPVGPQDQPDYVNAVAELHTQLSPEALLDVLQHIEKEHNRVRLRHWGERTLDLDILLYGTQTLNTARLIIPHAQMCQRSFVLYPLAEIAPDLTLPDGRKLPDVLRMVTNDLLPLR
jgi:2-amino-4-hydroxy-6-hydroxymethyldihydropteridine diphosphokinase